MQKLNETRRFPVKNFRNENHSHSRNHLSVDSFTRPRERQRNCEMAYAVARRTLASALTRTLASTHTCSKSSFSSRSRFAVALLNKQQTQLLPDLVNITTRSKHSGQGYSPLNDATPNWSNRPPKETILLDGCDYEHWLIVMEYDDPKPSEEEMINSYVKTLATVLGRYQLDPFP